MKKLIIDIIGQDGFYLAGLLLAKDREVHGITRRASTFNTARFDHLYRAPHAPEARLFLHCGDLSDGMDLRRFLEKSSPAREPYPVEVNFRGERAKS